MIGRIDIRANAAHPNFPLPPVYMFAGAPSSPRVFGVPARMGSWAITAVSVAVAFPDNSTRTVSLTQEDGTWIGVIPACATTGAVQNGVQIVADGTDENGDAVTGYCLGVGDLFVMERDFTATADGTRYYFHYCEETPATPQVGDAVYADGVLKWWDGTAWRDFGGSSITIDPALSETSENPVQNKVVAKALDGKLDGLAAYPAWDATISYGQDVVCSYKGSLYISTQLVPAGVPPDDDDEQGLNYWTEVTIDDMKQDALSGAQMDAVNSGATAAKVATWDGYAAQIAQKANSADVNAALAQKASLTDLPYAMVEPGKWAFSGSGYAPSRTYRVRFSEVSDFTYAFIEVYDPVNDSWEMAAPPLTDVSGTELSLSWDNGYFIATRASLPGHLLDRAGNRVVVSGDTTLTLPAANPGYIRDFLVRLEISGSTVPTITFAAPTGEAIAYETDGDEFPVPDEAGTWLYSFTESCVAHKFAVSLKSVNVVAQGGS